ncbi:MAG: GTP 3',8-cyclase MoaA [Gemmatimonadales bacterium]
MSAPVHDIFARPLRSLRLSVTDRCNMRCRYCMPEAEYVWLPRESILTFEEIARLVAAFAGVGVRALRLTGGEPLLRHELDKLVTLVRGVPGITDLALTTNGILLAEQAPQLKAAGLRRVTVSLDTLRPERLREFARTARHGDIVAGIAAARRTGLPVKINSVVIRGFNDDELAALIDFAREHTAEVRFIEYMDVGGATRWSPEQVVSRQEIVARLAARFGAAEPLAEKDRPSAPADRFRLPDGTTFGIIASTTAPFCGTCDRARLTADGHLFLCLYAETGVDLRPALRGGASDDELRGLVAGAWGARRDRGAEERLRVAERGVLHSIDRLRADPHREMHTRGG